ncbi:MAG: (deoxy)nucleoside triphosphate pyrophosphohydrolase [Candidatus Eisenbacteria bacterium]|nr:(deoxy)nucleoside triphosphate pyrophosphohydrolase [Candidatus Eisenbacteria bacterium]
MFQSTPPDLSAGLPLFRVGVAVVLRASSQSGTPPFVLVGRRRSDVHLPDLWEFPGGKLEPGESAEAGALRELQEETEVEAVVRYRLRDELYHYVDRSVQITFVLCDYRAGVPATAATCAVRWVGLASLQVYRFPDASVPVIDQLQQLEGVGPKRGSMEPEEDRS